MAMRQARRGVTVLALALALAGGARLPVPGFLVAPGPVEPAARYVRVAGARAGGGPILFATVMARPARAADLLAAALPERAVVPHSAVMRRGQSLADYLEEGRAQMDESQHVAVYVALRHLGRPARLEREAGRWRVRTPVPVAVRPPEAAGPSAALAFALEVARQLGAGMPQEAVAATGALDPEGRVLPVGGVPLKVRAAERAGAALVLVPAADAAAARAAARGARVVAVADFAAAVRAALTRPSGPPYNGASLEGGP